MKKIKFKNYVVIIAMLFFAAPVFAARIFFEPAEQTIGIGGEFEVSVYLDAEKEAINAVGAEINYPRDGLQLTDWSDGGSIINFWVKRPQNEDGKIFFEGVILGAHRGDKGLLATFKFKALKEGITGASFVDSSQAFIHDGKGTKAKLTFKDLKIAVSQAAFSPPPAIKDTEPPELFEPIVAADPNVFGGQYFLIFKTEDSGSGMDYFDVLETSPFWTLREPKFERAESPHLLKDQKLESIIRVRAVDKAGNARLAELPPKNFPQFVWHKNPLIWILILLILIVSADIGILVWRVVEKKPKEIKS